MAFSTSSLTTEAGLSTTSPAAILFASSSGITRIFAIHSSPLFIKFLSHLLLFDKLQWSGFSAVSYPLPGALAPGSLKILE
jgi:hypothetical protein